MLKLLFLCMILTVFNLSFAFAEQPEKSTTETVPQQIAAPLTYKLPKWNAQLTSYYLDFQGRKGADNHLYEFGQISSRIDLLSLNYTLNSNWTLNALVQHSDSIIETRFPLVQIPQYKKSVDHVEGFGDTSLLAAYKLKASSQWLVLANMGLSLPTGTIDNKSQLPGLTAYNMAYNAQLGSGTFDGLTGFTALYFKPEYQMGSRFLANLRAGTNNNGYRLGNQYRLDAWFDYKLKYGFTPRITGYYRHRDGIIGADHTRGRKPADRFYYNNQINWDISAALQYTHTFKRIPLQLTAEAGIPIAQDFINVDNAFVAANYYASLSLSKTF